MLEYVWKPATGLDVPDIVAVSIEDCQREIDTIFTPEPTVFARNITFAVVNQFYLPGSELISVARDSTGHLVAYTWAKSGERAAWSDDTMLSVRMAHVDLSLSTRQRFRLITDMMQMWEQYAVATNCKIISSNTMRKSQDAFLKLHARSGYDVRGSYAYKRLA